MSLRIAKSTGSALRLAKPTGASVRITPSWQMPDDPDAATYIAAVEAADGQALETATRMAIR